MNLKNWKYLACTALLAVFCVTASAQSSYQEIKDAAEKEIKAKQPEKAIELYRKSLSSKDINDTLKSQTLTRLAWLYGNKKDFARASEQMIAASAIESKKPEQKADCIKSAADYLMKGSLAEKRQAVALLKTLGSDEKLSAAYRLGIYLKINSYLEQLPDTARNMYEDSFAAIRQLKDLKPVELAILKNAEGNYFRRYQEYAKAVKLYDEAASYPMESWRKSDILNTKAACLLEWGKPEEAIALYLQTGRGYSAVEIMAKKDPSAAAELAKTLYGEKKLGDRDFMRALILCCGYKKLAIHPELWKTFVEAKPELAEHFDLGGAMSSAAYEYVVAAAPYVLKNTKNEKTYKFARMYEVHALSQLGRYDEAKTALKDAAKDEKIKDVFMQFHLKVADDAIGKDRPAAAGAAKRLVDEYKAKMDVKKIPDGLSRAGSTALMLQDRNAALGIVDCRESLYSSHPDKQVVCEYYDRLPQDVEGWMMTDIVKHKKGVQKLDRQLWSASLDLLIATDAANTGRVVEKKQNAYDTDLYFACDAKAFYVLLIAYDKDAKLVDAGLKDGGEYEGYLAPGPFQPYVCFLKGILQPVNTFTTAYPGQLTAAPKFKDGQLKYSTRLVADDAIATLLVFPWEFYYNTLPDTKGAVWNFDVMRWTGPGSSWNGTVSVHNRSTFGNVEFNLTPKQLTAIRKNILFKAKSAFQGQLMNRRNRSRGTGIVNHWSDKDLGDPAFCEAKVMPLVNELNAEAEKITYDMTDEEVNRIYRDYAYKMMQFPYLVQQLRTKYLSDRAFAEDPAVTNKK